MLNKPDIIRILLIEDNPADSDLIKDLLEEAHNINYELIVEITLCDGLLRAEKERFNILLLDLTLPDAMGLETFKIAHSRIKHLPIIILSGYNEEEIILQAMKEGVQDYVIKGSYNGILLWRSIKYSIERHNLKQKLKESEIKYRKLFDNAPDAISLLDSKGYIVDCNSTYLKLTGYPFDEVYKTHVTEFLTAEGVDIFEQRFPLLKESGKEEIEVDIVHKTGRIIPVWRKCIGIFDEEDNFTGAILHTRDLTLLKRNEIELMKAQKLESLGILAGGIAHDFNNILTAILGNISLAEFELRDEKIKSLLLSAEKAATRAKSLTKQLLLFSKGGTISKKPVSVEELLREYATFALRGTKAKCIFLFPRELWSVELDAGQFSQVINNLMINAVQAMPNGGEIIITGENKVSDRSELPNLITGNYVKISIKDQGLGIDRKDFQKIFSPYYTTKSHGTGLGLAMSYAIIKNHGGFMTFDSELDKGTIFYIYLPASVKEVKQEISTITNDYSGSGRILVMDDKIMIRQIMKKMLNKLGYESDYVDNGVELIRKYKNSLEIGKKYDIIITDLTIQGGMGGINAMEIILEIDPNVKAIVSSGYSKGDIMTNYKKYGFLGILSKPYTFNELKQVISSVEKSPIKRGKQLLMQNI
jgi:PAS domain S-box-containing protein